MATLKEQYTKHTDGRAPISHYWLDGGWLCTIVHYTWPEITGTCPGSAALIALEAAARKGEDSIEIGLVELYRELPGAGAFTGISGPGL